jgi:hypothetical protein
MVKLKERIPFAEAIIFLALKLKPMKAETQKCAKLAGIISALDG